MNETCSVVRLHLSRNALIRSGPVSPVHIRILSINDILGLPRRRFPLTRPFIKLLLIIFVSRFSLCFQSNLLLFTNVFQQYTSGLRQLVNPPVGLLFCPRNSHKPSHALVSICLNAIFLLLGKSLNRFSAVRNLKPLTGSLKVLAGIQELNDYNIIFVLLERKNESTDRNSTTTVLDKTETTNKHYKPNVEEEKVNTLQLFSNGIQYNYNTFRLMAQKHPS